MSWPTVELGELVLIKGGGTPSKKEESYWGGEVPWASVKDLKSDVIYRTQDYITEDGVNNSSTNIIPANTIITATRMALGVFVINEVPMAINQDLKALLINDETKIDKWFLFRFLQSMTDFIESEGKGATVKGVTLDFLRGLEVPLPPLDEQKRIAAILDKADAIRRKRQQAIQLADDFLRSVFLEMFGDPVANPKGWEVKRLGDCLHFLTSGSRGWAKYYSETGSKFIRIMNVGRGKLLLNDMAYVTAPNTKEAERTRVQEQDVLLSITADLGRAAVVDKELEGSFINQHLALLRPDSAMINSKFLAKLLSSSSALVQFKAANKSAVKAGLNFTDIREFKLVVPPANLQKKFELVSDMVEKSIRKVNSAANEKESLFYSLSQKAFSGEL